MPDTKITALTAIGANPIIPATFPIPMVDLTDTSMAASGTTKKVTVNQILGAGGTATLASATISGAATVGTTLGVTGVSTLTGNAFANGSATVAGGTPGAFANAALTINNRGGVSDLSLIALGYRPNGTVLNGAAYIGFIATSGAGNVLGDLIFGTRSVTTDTAPTERYRIDSTGIATWSNVGGVAGTAMTLNATGLGVGGNPTSKLTIKPSASSSGIFEVMTGSTNTDSLRVSGGGTVNSWLELRGYLGVKLYSDATNTVTVDAAGNCGIGVAPSAINVGRGLEVGAVGNGLWCNNSSYNQLLQNAYNTSISATGWRYAAAASTPAVRVQLGGGEFNVYNAVAGTAGNDLTWTPRLTLDASGNLLVGKTSSANSAAGVNIYKDATDGGRVYLTRQSGSAVQYNVAFFESGGSAVGSISTTNTATSYNISSDYRLKEAVQPLVGGLARISALKPSIYKWKIDGSSSEGFLAHELAEAVPLAVTGEKDDVNEDGSIKPQAVDLSKVVPVLVAAIQELTARVQTLEAK